MSSEAQLIQQNFLNLNPATGEVISEHHICSPAEVRQAVVRARQAQPAWASVPVPRRIAIMRRFQESLSKQRKDVAARITAECGKPVVESLLTEVMVVLDAARFCAENAFRVLRPEPIPYGNPAMKLKRGRLFREPIGVIGIISPWNYPFSIPATETLAALVLGNAVVLKPSELTPNSALILQQLLHEAGIPEDVFHVVLGQGPTGEALIDSDIDKIIFTGSVHTGKRVGEAAAKKLLPAVLELGGKDPMLVLDDADVDVASSAAVWGALMNAGQTCLSVERCYVHQSIYDRFIAACTQKMSTLRVGNGADRHIDIGPLISERQVQLVEAQIEDAKARGARVLAGGRRLPELGPNFYAPTLVVDVTHDMRLMREETFGPVLPVIPFADDHDAVRLANDSEFGLAASVWTKNSRRGEQVAARLNAGTVMINDVLTCFAISEAPHGGVKASGIGLTHGLIGMQEMVRVKFVDTDLAGGMKKVWWYPYGETFGRQMDAFVDLLFARGARRIRGIFGSAGSLRRKRL